jgi:hypothetical protein
MIIEIRYLAIISVFATFLAGSASAKGWGDYIVTADQHGVAVSYRQRALEVAGWWSGRGRTIALIGWNQKCKIVSIPAPTARNSMLEVNLWAHCLPANSETVPFETRAYV